MSNSSWLIFALVFSFKCAIHSATLAVPMGRMEEHGTCQDGLMSKEAIDTAEDSRRFPVIEGRLADEDGTKRIFILSDLGWKGAAGSEASSAFGRPFPTLSLRRADRTFPGSLKDERRDADDLIPMARRDLDNKLLRCMIGRVYRPCWQA